MARLLLTAALLARAAVSFVLAPTTTTTTTTTTMTSLMTPTTSQRRHATTLLKAKLSAAYETALAAAEKASQEFGKASTEAKSAWEAVEEMNDAGNVAVASKPGLDEACDAEDSAECATYEEQMKQFSELLAQAKPALGDIKVKLETMQSVSLSNLMTSGATEKSSVDVEAATAAAEKASADFGKDSPEAKAAWEAVEELYDAGNPAVASAPALDESCIADAVDKCEAFETAMEALESAVKQAA